MDFSKDGKAFEVKAACSGTVTKKDNDALLGWVVTITNENGFSTTYQLSLIHIYVDSCNVL